MRIRCIILSLRANTVNLESLELLTIVEGIASLLSLLCVILAAKNKISNWPLAILASLVYSYVFYQNRFFSEAYLQIVFIGFQLYGWWFWSSSNPNKKEKNIAGIPLRSAVVIFVVFLICYWAWFQLYQELNPDARQPLLDTFLTVLSITALFMQARRWIENWFLWILADILYVPMFVKGEQYITAALYFVFIGIAAKGYLMWRDEMKKAPN